jgi:hypothetical protein
MTIAWLPASGPLRMGGLVHANDAVGALLALTSNEPIPFCHIVNEDEAKRGWSPLTIPRPGGDI